ncbi:hypothetical protein ACLKA6_004338 [Drosophila palustris]
MKAVLLLLALVGVAQAWSLSDFVAQFESFKVEFNKLYKDVMEERERLIVYLNNMQLIKRHNQRYAAGKESYEMGVNQFTDLSPEEFKSLMLSSINASDLESNVDHYFNSSENVLGPSSFDWRTKGAVTPVKNQGSCGSCWAFSATGVLESHHFIKNGQLVALSEQHLVDCTRGSPYYQNGCQGGWPARALTYVKDNGGINTESSYPYEGKDRNCRFDRNNIGAKVVNIFGVPSGNEPQLANAVAEKGPISVAIDASLFQSYRGGVFNQPSCKGRVNHAVLVVGYGTDKKGGDYWIVKNSWGSNWGENGYIRMARNRNNQCQIASYGVYTTV